MQIHDLLRKVVRFYRLVRASDDFKKLKYGSSFIVGTNCLIYPSQFISFGNNTAIGRDVIISTSKSGRSPIQIGDHVMIAQRVMIIGGNHEISQIDVPMDTQGEGKQGPITIEDDVWIGAGSIILTGITIGKGAVVGAGSVVTKSVEPYSIVAGNPARLIGKRI
ncbi:acyltransferase [Sulfurovum indicum]|uniref:Acyltransferase n=1 Tax=Sulfurovum indicum TaxID=2779528 RepID=A0A7M1S5C8_9BACT|nr:acyltransferase [Sulfurovum indicum]QOR62623.1 acyltransferase [Sulfurovum indicum]